MERAPKSGRDTYLFSPASIGWRVNREAALLLGGGRALLMQIAHPAVAQGVADHSHFRQEPLRRLRRTMNTVWSIDFGELNQAQNALRRVDEVHQRVRGEVQSGKLAGRDYDARDPRLLLWVHATLVDSALATHDRFVRPLSATEKKHYYEEMKKFGALFGIPGDLMPPSLADFYVYMQEMIGGGELAVGETARDLARDILRPRPWLLRPGAPLQSFVTAGLLPPRLREAYELDWSERKEKRLGLLCAAVRRALPLLPDFVRVVPQARAAEKRLRRTV